MNRDKTLLKELQAFNAVAAGQVANTVVPSKGPTYLAFFIEYKSSGTLANDVTMAADITNVQVKVNGDAIVVPPGGHSTGAVELKLCLVAKFVGGAMIDATFDAATGHPD